MDDKHCARCGKTKPADKEHWYFRNGKPASGPCKDCRKILAKENYYKDPVSANRRAREYRANNREKIIEIARKWRESNADYVREKNREKYLANREDRIAYERERRRSGIAAAQDRARRAINPQKYKEKKRQVRKNQEERDPEYRVKRAAQLREARMRDPERFKSYDAKRYSDPKGNLDRRVNASIRTCLRRKGGRKTSAKAQFLSWTIDDLMRHLEALFEEGMSWDNMGDWHIDHIVPLSAVKYESEYDVGFQEAWALSNLAPLWATDNLEKNANVHWQLPDTYKNPRLRELYDTRDIALFVFG